MTELSFHPNGHFARLSFAIASGSNNLKRLRLFYGAKPRSWPTLSPLNRGWKIHGHVKAATYFLTSNAPPDLLISS
jgi:hypothetical protein